MGWEEEIQQRATACETLLQQIAVDNGEIYEIGRDRGRVSVLLGVLMKADRCTGVKW